MLRLKGLALLLLTSLFLLVSLTLSAQTDASAQPQLPRFVRFSGAIASSSASVVGVTFSLYTSDQGGTPLWVETQNVSVDASGRYSVLLGAATRDGLPSDVFTSNEARWIGVKVDGQPELPRVLLVSVPYALKAGDAETLGGKPLSAFLLAPETSSSVTDPAVASTVTAGTATTAQSSRVALPRTASGAQNYVAKFDATGANLINSSLFDNGNVGIGTSSPGATLEVDNVSSTGMNAVTTNANLTNNSPLTGQVTSAMNLNIYDFSTAANLSKQTLRVGYIRTSNATGNVTAFDTLFTASPSINGDAPYQLRGINVESPNVASGKTLNTWIGAYFTAPGGAGTISNRYALVTEPGSGNVGIGTTNPSNLLTVNGTIQSTSGGFMFPDGTTFSSGAAIQKRVTGTCSTGTAIQSINADGTVVCVPIGSVALPSGFSVFGNSPALTLTGYHYSGTYAEVNGQAWSSGMAVPVTGAHNFAYAVFNDKIYVFGISSTSQNVVYQYDPSASSWTKKTNMPTARSYATAVPYGNYIYVFGGASASVSNVCERYDPSNDVWASAGTCANLPTGMLGMAGTAVPNVGIYLIGGTADFSTYSTKIMKYDPTLNSYSKVADLSTGTSYGTAVYTNNLIYVMGGTTSASQTTTQNVAFDPVGLSVSSKTALTDARAFHVAAVSTSGQIYIAGGNPAGVDLAFLLYDPASDKFTTFPQLLFGHNSGGGGVISDGRFIIFGDSTNQSVDIFQPNSLLYQYAAN